MSDIFDDIAWAWRMFRTRRIRRGLPFSHRQVYDRAIRPSSSSGCIVAYPDAFYYVQKRDMVRAAASVERTCGLLHMEDG